MTAGKKGKNNSKKRQRKPTAALKDFVDGDDIVFDGDQQGGVIYPWSSSQQPRR